MQILSYPIGLLIGLFPIAVDLGESRAPAHVLLDSRPVCEVTERSPGCTIDLGPDPRVHLLELLRTDNQGRVTERVKRWINRPGIEPEVVASGGCDDKRSTCEFVITWAHPQKLDPKRLTVLLDGVERWKGTGHHAAIALAKGAHPQILVCDAEFPDETRASYTRALYAFYPEEAQASLLAVPIVPEDVAATGELLAGALGKAGWPARTVEATEPEVTFVMDWKSLDIFGAPISRPGVGESFRWPTEGSKAFHDVGLVFPQESLPARTVRLSRLGAVRPDAPRSRFSRYADAVAAAGYALGARPHARAVVLILHGFDRPNVSSFTAAQAQAYLAEVMVPLYVWRLGNVEAPEWPDGPRLKDRSDLLAALEALRADVDRQRIAWIEGSRDVRYLGRWLAPGVALAGRGGPIVLARATEEAGDEAPGSPSSLGPDGGPVHALAVSPDGMVVFAATNTGVFRRRQGNARWERRSAGLRIAPVRSLAAPGDGAVIIAGTEAGVFRSTDSGLSWVPARGTAGLRAASLAVDSGNPRLLYAGTEGSGVWRSDDSGASWLKTAMGQGDTRALAVDPRSHRVFAASESGLSRSDDRGLTWTALPAPASRVLAFAISATDGRLLAATSGDGVLASADAGQSWTSIGPARAYLTSVSVGEAGRRLLAGSPDGVYASEDGGKSWKLSRCGSVDAILDAGFAPPLAGGTAGVLRRDENPASWRSFDTGLTATIVHAVAGGVGAEESFVATSTGLLRRERDGRWDRFSDVPDGVAAYALRAAANDELLLGTSGSIGRRDESGSGWDFRSTFDAFAFASEPTQPRHVLAATRGGVLRSADGGRDWTPPGTGLEKTIALQLGVAPAEPPVFYAATAGGGVFRSVDSGASWKPGGLELTRRIVRCVVVDAAGHVYAGTDGGVFSSADRGESWLPRDEGLPRAPVYALAADDASATLFAGTAQGLFRTTDRGTSWTPFPGAGLRVPVTSLSFAREANALLVGSYGAGVFMVPLPPPPHR